MTHESMVKALHSGNFQPEHISTLRVQGGLPHPTMTAKHWWKGSVISKRQTHAGFQMLGKCCDHVCFIRR